MNLWIYILFKILSVSFVFKEIQKMMLRGMFQVFFWYMEKKKKKSYRVDLTHQKLVKALYIYKH